MMLQYGGRVVRAENLCTEALHSRIDGTRTRQDQEDIGLMTQKTG